MLEGFMPREEIKLVHSGTVQERYEAMMNGETDAATLMEPWITLAHKNGCKEIIGTFYQGTENAGADLDKQVWEAANRAVKKAVQLVNADPRKYVHYMLDEIPSKYSNRSSRPIFLSSRRTPPSVQPGRNSGRHQAVGAGYG